jgi:RNA polymerase sigma-70 factor (ECF subfamily)
MKKQAHHTDAYLVTALNSGDREAFEIIYRTYAPELFRRIQRNVTTREDCEEILHDVFEWLWTKHRELKINSLRPYLYRMIHNRIIKFFLRNKVKRKYERHFLLFEAMYEQLHEEEPDETIDPDTLQSLLDTSLTQLPERCQAAFRLRLSGMTNGEIAESMNIRKDTVENYMVKAISHLRNSYKSLYRVS